jgi:hypothetical protein
MWIIKERNMGTLVIDVTNSGTTATYDKKSGPGTVSTAGKINFAGQGAGQESITWNLSSGTFATPPITLKDSANNPLPSGGEFTWPATGGSNSLTLTDKDSKGGAEYNYCLKTSGGDLDPKIINRT